MDSENRTPIEPPETGWHFPPPADVDSTDGDGPLAVGADLAPGTLLQAYRNAYFPMPLTGSDAMGWWSPDPRGIIEVADFHVSRSLRRSMRRLDVSTNQAFSEVVDRCGDPRRPHGWINAPIRKAYVELHRLGWAHSIEVWADLELVGGLYGVGIGAFFAGESMFHLRTDASKAAVVALVEILAPCTDALFDVQWATPHLTSIGAVEVGRPAYLARLTSAIAAPGPTWVPPQQHQ